MGVGSFRLSHKWFIFAVVTTAEFLAMTVWFSASAVVPALTTTWGLGPNGQAWLTMSVQAGFAIGALAFALMNLPDLMAMNRLFALCAVAAAVATAMIAHYSAGLTSCLVLRFLTGFALAGVYPGGMKMMVAWTFKDRGLGIGLIVGALTLGAALPHLTKVFSGQAAWQSVLYCTALLAGMGGGLAALSFKDGPYGGLVQAFDIKYVKAILTHPEMRRVNLAYMGHMWELYAMWAWVPLFMEQSFLASGVDTFWASLASFSVVAVGVPGSVLAGVMADRIGRVAVTVGSMVISGACAGGVGFLFGCSPWLIWAVCLIWGFSVVADSAQFSACLSELCCPESVGTALTLQASLGFLVTLVAIQVVPHIQLLCGWGWAFAILAPGPVVGIWAMLRVKPLPMALQPPCR